MNSIPINLRLILLPILVFGIVGGMMLVGMHLLINSNLYFEQGLWIIPNYAAIMLSTVLWLQTFSGIRINYKLSFFTGIFIFILLTLALYTFASIVFTKEQLVEHASRLLLMLGLAVAAIAGFSQLFRTRTHKDYQDSVC